MYTFGEEPPIEFSEEVQDILHGILVARVKAVDSGCVFFRSEDPCKCKAKALDYLVRRGVVSRDESEDRAVCRMTALGERTIQISNLLLEPSLVLKIREDIIVEDYMVLECLIALRDR